MQVFAVLWFLFCVSEECSFAQTKAVTKEQVEAQARKSYTDAREKWLQTATDPEVGWQLGRASFDLADLADSGRKRGEYAAQGIEACRRAISQSSNCGPAHYYLAMNLGQRARTDKLAALRIIREMEREFLKAIEMAPKFDYAGAARCLGVLYRDAPGWPTGVGNNHKAIEKLNLAVQLAPEYPDNWITLLETYIATGEKRRARDLMRTAEARIQEGRKQFSGEQWAWSWQEDWSPRWEKVKSKGALQNLESPRTKEW